MEIKSRTLRALCAVVESGSLQMASRRVALSPSALSRVIAQLEADLDIALFDRTERRLVPTLAGRAFYARAREAIVLWDDLATFGRDLRKEARRPLRIAALSRHAEGIVAPALARLAGSDPRHRPVRLEVHAQRDFGFSRLARPFDLGFGHLVGQHADLWTIVLARSPIVAVIPPGHPAAGPSMPAETLADEPLVLLARDTVIGRTIGERLDPVVPRHVVAEVSHTSVALRLVIEGLGLHVTDQLAAIGAERLGCRLLPVMPAVSIPFLAFRPRNAEARGAELAAMLNAILTMLRAAGAEPEIDADRAVAALTPPSASA